MLSKLLIGWSLTALCVIVHAIGMTVLLRWLRHSTARVAARFWFSKWLLFLFSHRNEFEKIAVVGNPRWEAGVLAFTGAGLRKGPVKFFSETGESEARACLAE